MAGEREVAAINTVGAKPGDRVMVTTETGSYLKITFLLYIVPVLALLAGVAAGGWLAGRTGWDQSLCGALFGLAAVVPALFFIRYQGNRMAVRSAYRPKVSRILAR